MADACGSCGAPVIWRKHERTGKRAPLDYNLSDAGNCQLVGADLYAIIPPPELERLHDQGFSLRMNHFATCPQAERWHQRAS